MKNYKVLLLVAILLLSIAGVLYCGAGAVTDNFSFKVSDKAVDSSHVNMLWVLGAIISFFIGGIALAKLKKWEA